MPAFSREWRCAELESLRYSDPTQIVVLYRNATHSRPDLLRLPSPSFSYMIDVILDYEADLARLP